jgi:hypothetical protein
VEIRWIIDRSVERKYRDFIARYYGRALVAERVARNIRHVDVEISKAIFWRTLVGCLLTTQQRSGEGSRVSTFLQSDDNLLQVRYCLATKNLAAIAEKTLGQYGLRRGRLVGVEMARAAAWLGGNGWDMVRKQLKSIVSHTTKKRERLVAQFLQQHVSGLGPKQSRNLIQWMGLTKYEIPLDSRLVKVLRGLAFPVPLSAAALADESYYCFVEDGLQQLLKRIGVYPCIFDACAFASLEKPA